MSIVAIEEAAQRLDELVQESQSGREVVLTRANHPVAKIVPLAAERPSNGNGESFTAPREPGSAAHLPHFMADDFDAIPEGFEEYLP